MLALVPNPNRLGEREVPFCFVAVSGQVSPNKIYLANAMVVDWQLRLKKVKVKEGECPWYQPSTQAVNLRTFFAHMSKCHNWQFSEVNLKDFTGALDGVLKAEFARRFLEWVS